MRILRYTTVSCRTHESDVPATALIKLFQCRILIRNRTLRHRLEAIARSATKKPMRYNSPQRRYSNTNDFGDYGRSPPDLDSRALVEPYLMYKVKPKPVTAASIATTRPSMHLSVFCFFDYIISRTFVYSALR
uniref:Uncharacterized protein n=1 Tax=Ditylenchus dipsaci TaxID=166011 RepID=A0A915EL37_9BILA